MDREEEHKIYKLMKEARDKARGYADFFGWAPDRDQEELGVVVSLAESMEATGELFFSSIKSRGRPNDPPDCEALSTENERIAIEVTELVDGKAISDFKRSKVLEWAEWSKERFLFELNSAILKKDSRYPHLKEPPYPGGYIVVVHTDELFLNYELVTKFIDGHRFDKPKFITRAFLLLGYNASCERCPYFEISFSS